MIRKGREKSYNLKILGVGMKGGIHIIRMAKKCMLPLSSQPNQWLQGTYFVALSRAGLPDPNLTGRRGKGRTGTG